MRLLAISEFLSAAVLVAFASFQPYSDAPGLLRMANFTLAAVAALVAGISLWRGSARAAFWVLLVAVGLGLPVLSSIAQVIQNSANPQGAASSAIGMLLYVLQVGPVIWALRLNWQSRKVTV